MTDVEESDDEKSETLLLTETVNIQSQKPLATTLAKGVCSFCKHTLLERPRFSIPNPHSPKAQSWQIYTGDNKTTHNIFRRESL